MGLKRRDFVKAGLAAGATALAGGGAAGATPLPAPARPARGGKPVRPVAICSANGSACFWIIDTVCYFSVACCFPVRDSLQFLPDPALKISAFRVHLHLEYFPAAGKIFFKLLQNI